MRDLGLYLHVPFCKSKCAYCDFYSLPGQGEELRRAYTQALLTHLALAAPLGAGWTVETVYLGGGTPLLLGSEALAAVLERVRTSFDLAPGAEVTVELNPDSTTEEDLRRLRGAGVNRVSLGMQSALDRELRAVGRPHTAAQTAACVRAARRAGFENLSLDLIYGLPGQSLADWRTSLEAALALEPEHLSCYGLTLEPGTPLARRAAAGEVLPDGDEQADAYLFAVERLAQAGYEQYEISNFARPGRMSRHNGRYWVLRPYLGFGPGAHSDFGGRRFSYPRDLGAYLRALGAGEWPDREEDQAISRSERAREYVMLGLRTAQGIDLGELRERYGLDPAPLEPLLKELEGQGWARRRGTCWRLTPEGFLRSNPILVALLDRLPLGETAP